MKLNCCFRYRKLLISMFLVAAVFLCQISCVTDSSLSDAPVEKEVLLINHNSDNPDSAPENDKSINNSDIKKTNSAILEDVRDLWIQGFYENARERFNLDSSEKDDEWHFWRGKLFVEQWSGLSLGLSGENISALMSDNDDVWAGTWTGGLIRFSEPLKDSTVWDPGLPSLAVRTVNRILLDKNTVWIVRYASLERFEKRTGKWFSESSLPADDRLQDLCIIKNDSYLATLGYGLWIKKRRTWNKLEFPGLFINRLEKGKEDELLIGTMDRGLYLYNTADGSIIRPPPGLLRKANITSLIRSDRYIIGGTYGEGAFIWDTLSSEVQLIDSERLGDPWVLCVNQSEDKFFFGTFGTGLNSFDIKTGKWDRIGLAEGIISADIASLMKDESGNIWAGTLGGGIIRISGSMYDY